MERDWTKTVGALEITKEEESDATKRAKEVEEKVKCDVEIALVRTSEAGQGDKGGQAGPSGEAGAA